jgi:hypothetical protein
MGRVKVKMESLALIVAALVALVLFTGPIALLLTSKLFWEFTHTYKGIWWTRRLMVAAIALVGMPVQMVFIFNQIPPGVKALSFLGFVLNTVALKREFVRNVPWSSLFKVRSGDENGPADQK